MIYVFDLDWTLCSKEEDVYTAKPYLDRISFVNELHDAGNVIYIDTSRGYVTWIDHQEKTEEQLRSWWLKYTKLRTGVKIYWDFYIDDKWLSDKEFFEVLC